jgi:hypothetical protein
LYNPPYAVSQTHILPVASSGSVLDQLEGFKTKYISASQSPGGTVKFRPTSDGVIVINKETLEALGSTVVDQATLLFWAKKSIVHGPGIATKNVLDADEVLITGGIPKAAIVYWAPPPNFYIPPQYRN